MKINISNLTPKQTDHLLNNMHSAFIYIVEKEYSIKEAQIADFREVYNHPQWLASLSLFSVDNAGKMGLVDSAALFPLNTTKQRVFGARTNRKKLFNDGFKVAQLLASDYELNKDNMFTGLSIQLAILFSSCIWVDFLAMNKDQKNNAYLDLWVGFSGSVWKQKYAKGFV